VSGLLEVPRLLEELDGLLGLTPTLVERALDEQLRRRLHEAPPLRSYAAVLDEVVVEFFGDFLQEHGDRLKEQVRSHIRRVREGGQP
jgi:hypothetical protein